MPYTRSHPAIRLKLKLRRLYKGKSEEAEKFRYAVLAIDIAALIYLFVSSFFYGHWITYAIDALLGTLFLADYLARLWVARAKKAFLLNFFNLADLVAIASLLAPLTGEQLAFLRVARTLRLLRSYHVLRQLREDWPYFRRHEDIFLSVVNLAVFLFVMTALVFETQIGRNPAINNYVDALYFTVTALTTTGFGDITLVNTPGKLLAIAIMIFGVTLFIRLIQTIFRPYKIRHTCESCGLFLHDADASHCKACGNVINIPNEGL